MDSAIHDYLRDALRHYDDYLAEQAERTSEIERRLDNLQRAGKVIEIHQGGQHIKVASGDNTTPWIHWFAAAAGLISDYRCPSVGEQCLLLSYSGGRDTGQCWALCGIPCEQWPLPGHDPSKHITDYGNGVKVRVDPAAQTVTVEAGALKSTGEVVDQVRSMAADRAIYDDHDHGFSHGAPATKKPNQPQG